MPKRRVAGAARPYTYTARYSWIDAKGVRRSRTVERWKIQLDLGEDSDGHRRRKTFTASTSAGAKAKYDEARGQLARQGTLADRRTTLGNYIDLYLETARQRLSPGSYDHYHSALSTHLTDIDRAMRVSDILPGDIRLILDRMRRTGLSLPTRRLMHSCLSQVFELALADRVVDVNPVRSVRLAATEAARDSGRRAFSVPELRSILEATLDMGVADAAIWWWRLFTGMRQSEILGALMEDLHLEAEEPYYVVSGQLALIPRDHGCGRPVRGAYPCGRAKGGLCPQAVWRIPDGFRMRHLTGGLCIKSTKSHRPRIVPVVPELAEVMRRYLVATADRPNPYGLIFRDAEGNPRGVKADNREFHELLHAAGIDDPDRTGHETRYSAVTLMRKAGKDSKAIESMIGHTSLKVDDIYMTIDPDMQADTARAIPRALGRAAKRLPGIEPPESDE